MAVTGYPDLPDAAALQPVIDRHAPAFGPIESIEKTAAGQSNPTFVLTGQAGARMVLRRKPFGTLLKSAHAIEREYRVMDALAGTDVPVPRMIHLEPSGDLIGAPFFLMDHVGGESRTDPRLTAWPRDRRAPVMADMARVLARLHRLDPARIGLGDFGPPGNYFARQLGRWTKQYRATETGRIGPMDALIDWLEDHLDQREVAPRLVHGDYRIDNLRLDRAAGQVLAVLDWELSTLGDPRADLGAVFMQWAMPPGRLSRGLDGIDRDAEGLLPDRAFLEIYCAEAGLSAPPDLRFAIAFNFFRMGAILQGVKKRGLDGNASDPARAAALGALVPDYATRALATINAGS
ncbi:phosphotransferase family protein [Oceanomicrobium pacificus]|uniref:Phosphotransferase n=1 Tax=Oceanomicrobium pacificus TaxID=2692916 RepID=A0A6B0TX41_9RHOB|nr:phosphotransferase family protein [Oceanomicrobium pacificus]MXU65724.1 phosphotransferase [Oceanomicrobium pacificus]